MTSLTGRLRTLRAAATEHLESLKTRTKHLAARMINTRSRQA